MMNASVSVPVMPVVGTPGSYQVGSDRHAVTVVSVSKSGHRIVTRDAKHRLVSGPITSSGVYQDTMSAEEKAAIEHAKAVLLDYLREGRQGRTAAHFPPVCGFVGTHVHGTTGLPYQRVIDRALQELRRAGLIRFEMASLGFGCRGQWFLTL